MERKLLSLPNFFVLLLVAGIAFLAAPVVNVHAAAPTLTSITVPSTPQNGVFTVTFTFSEDLTASTFTTADIDVTFSPATGTDRAITGATVTTTAAAIASHTVSIPSPGADSEGEITIGLSKDANGDIDAAFTADDGSTTAFVPATPTTTTGAPTSADVDFDNIKPSVAVALATGVSGTQNGPFEVRFTLKETNLVTSGAGVFNPTAAPATAPATLTAATGDITIAGATIGDTATTGDATTTAGSVTRTIITPNADVTAVNISVAANAVMDTAGNGNDAVTLAEVVIDNTPPTVTVAPAYPAAADQDNPATADVNEDKDGIVTTGTTHSAGMAVTFKVRVTIVGADDAELDADEDLTVTDGTVSGDATADASTLANDYIVAIAQDNMKTATPNVTIQVPANAIMDAADNGNSASPVLTVAVTGGSDPMREEEEDPVTGTIGVALTDAVGFTLDPIGTNSRITIGMRDFVVLARSPDHAGFTNALPAAKKIDIADDAWRDLRHFLVTTEGGTIDLIGPTDTPVRSVVISEMMWGSDRGLSPEINSQWIELYNTTGAPITLNSGWKLQFSTKSYGEGMLTGNAAKAVTAAPNGAVTTTANPVVDKLSTWRKVGNVWAWRIEDTAGGSHGQSGKSTPFSTASPRDPLELISMQRKIDYAKVEKTHVSGAGKEVENRNKQLEGIPGTGSGNWEASPEHGYLGTYRKGTPGAKPVVQTFAQTGVPRGSVVFNEIANRSKKEQDWIELYNKSSSAKKINGWQLSVVTNDGTANKDDELFTFESGDSGDDIVVPAKGYLLIVNTSPSHRNNPLEGGYNTKDPGSSKRQGAASVRPYYVTNKLDIPEKDFLLILRNGNDKRGTHEKIEDIAGNNPRFEDANINTEVWPLRTWTVGATDDLGQKDDKTWVRDQGKAVFHGDEWKPDGGFTGVGIDRKYDSSDDYTSGTPGYANNAVQNEVKKDGLTEATPVVISEIMFATYNRAPQWIELHNPSPTQAVNLDKWKLEILNYFGDETLVVDHSATLTLPKRHIQPNQTLLIVSTSTNKTSSSDHFPEDRIIDVWDEPELRKALKMQSRRDAILSSTGFYLKLSDPKKVDVDEVGNIDANQHSNDEPAWTLPGGTLEEGGRSSMVRVEDTENDGEERDSWRDADQVDSKADKSDNLYYGDDEDVGTPGYTPGGVLPVQLSSFYSKRNDAGAVIITWSTESELDNAGFNILRSLSRVGEFTRINAQLIPGAGTTGEKNTYTWTDTSARPNVVYYYQIEDVSLDGEHRTLRTTRLRGYVGAAGKATTIWGELKSRD